MATGVPSGNKKSKKMDFEISYKGKKTEDQIINTDIKKIELVKEFEGLSEFESHGEVIYGDNIDALRSMLYSGRGETIDAVYIDPPYATNSNFLTADQNVAYEDNLTGAAFIEFIRERLILIHKLLKPTGSIFIHMDEKMAFPIKIIMDEVFGEQNFHNWITRKKSNPKNTVTKKFGDISDYIMFYSKSEKYTFNKQYVPWTEDTARKEYSYIDEYGNRFKKVPIHAPGVRNGKTGQPWRGMLPPKGKHWQYTPDKLDELDAAGRIFWSSTGNPRKKVYLKESKGMAVQDILLDYKDAHNQNITVTGYPTEKNISLIELLLKSVTNEGDVVLDAFAGSGTTAQAAINIGRNWVVMDNSPESLKTIQERISKQISVENTDLFSLNKISIQFENVLY